MEDRIAETPTLFLILLVRLFGGRNTRWIWHQRQQMRDPPTPFHRFCSRIRALALACNRFVALYDGGRQSLVRRGVLGDRISVIHNGVCEPTQEQGPGPVRESLGLPPDAPVIATVSGLIRRKRVDVAMRSLAPLMGRRGQEAGTALPKPVFLIMGDGPERPNLESLAQDLGIRDGVRFLGVRDDVRAILAESDIFVLGSDAEASPLAAIEAMSVGIPCVVTDAGAARELVEDAETGYVVPCGDVSLLGERLAELLRDPAKRQRFGTAARERWRSRFTLDRMVDEHVHLYRELGPCAG